MGSHVSSKHKNVEAITEADEDEEEESKQDGVKKGLTPQELLKEIERKIQQVPY